MESCEKSGKRESGRESHKAQECLLVKTAPEISLKSAPVRKQFMARLLSNLRTAMKNKRVSAQRIGLDGGRIFIYGKNLKALEKIVLNTFGIHSVATAWFAECRTLPEITEFASAYAKKKFRKGTFAVRANRAAVAGFTSRDLEVAIGSAILSAVRGTKVNLTKPEQTLYIEVRRKGTFCYVEETKALGGLPVGVEGSVAFFFEGSENDAVAALLLMKRGCNIAPVGNKAVALKQIRMLEKFNSFREFEILEEKNLPAIIGRNEVLALGCADAKPDFSAIAEHDSRYSLPVLRPLLLYPPEMFQEKLKLLQR